MFWSESFRNPYDKGYNLSFIRSTDIHENANIKLDDKSSKRQKSQKIICDDTVNLISLN